MLDGVSVFAATAVAWMSALLFFQVKSTKVFFYGLTAGAFGLTAWELLCLTGWWELEGAAFLLIFLLLMLSVGLQRLCQYGGMIQLLLLALGRLALLGLAGRLFPEAVWLPAGIAILCLAGMVAGRERFLTLDWEEAFEKEISGGTSRLKRWQIYGCLAASSTVMVLGYELIPALPKAAAVVVLAAFGGLWWGTLLCVLLMVHYRQEAVTLLLEQQYRDEMQSFMNVIRSQRHDYNFHVQTIAGMIQNGEYAACERYVDELVQDTMRMNTLLPVKDPAIAALIGSFWTLAAGEGIPMHIDIRSDLSQVVTNVYETNKIISNLLQNAMDEMRQHEDRSSGIQLVILKRGEYCVIRVSNVFYGKENAGEYLEGLFRSGYTTKQGHEGVGLGSIRTLLERYHGRIYIEVEGELIHVAARIPLRRSGSNGREPYRDQSYAENT